MYKTSNILLLSEYDVSQFYSFPFIGLFINIIRLGPTITHKMVYNVQNNRSHMCLLYE